MHHENQRLNQDDNPTTLASRVVLAHPFAVFIVILGLLMPALADILHPVSPSWSVRVNYQSFLLPYLWRSWLFDAGSLTARLKALRPGQFRVEVLNQYYDSPTSVERTEMRLSSNQKVWVREVVLMLGEVAVVYARTAIPLATLSGSEKRLQHLGNSSLGGYLFRQPHLKRGKLKVSRCAANDFDLTWARRSVFYFGKKPLMVSEAFSQQLQDLAN